MHERYMQVRRNFVHEWYTEHMQVRRNFMHENSTRHAVQMKCCALAVHTTHIILV